MKHSNKVVCVNILKHKKSCFGEGIADLLPFQSLQKNAIVRSRDILHNQPKSAYLCGAAFFPNTTHFRRINYIFPRTKYAGLAWFHNLRIFVAKSHIYISRKLKNVAFTSQKRSRVLYCHGNVMKWRDYVTWTSLKSCKQFLQVPAIFASSRNFIA